MYETNPLKLTNMDVIKSISPQWVVPIVHVNEYPTMHYFGNP